MARQTTTSKEQIERDGKIELGAILGDLAEMIHGLVDDESVRALVLDRIEARALGAGLEPIGQVGQRVALDRTIHEPLCGDPVQPIVIRPGYRCQGLVLHRAIVASGE